VKSQICYEGWTTVYSDLLFSRRIGPGDYRGCSGSLARIPLCGAAFAGHKHGDGSPHTCRAEILLQSLREYIACSNHGLFAVMCGTVRKVESVEVVDHTFADVALQVVTRGHHGVAMRPILR